MTWEPELDAFPPANMVVGQGRVDGRGSSCRATTSPCAAARVVVGDWGALPIAGGREAAYRRELTAHEAGTKARGPRP